MVAERADGEKGTLGAYREHDFKANPERIAPPFVVTADALAEEADEIHSHVTGRGRIKTLGESDPIILIGEHETPLPHIGAEFALKGEAASTPWSTRRERYLYTHCQSTEHIDP